ncbi:hypothetical protein GCK72_026086 [Caenorhabditis remanei]|uniref:60S ribosomal protein L21 n=1 Tax=Caenorhabditis remanei TaxID=31234 RepID=A0A6A5G3P9_CAERE|nr:hypothetical protein GCK72_026086 [Caenorhabditis remanei]KAF1749618.1 hypothetical protein GCK72_026086 [Caenorhabditis remanei]
MASSKDCRRGPRYMFARNFRKYKVENLSTYHTQCKRGKSCQYQDHRILSKGYAIQGLLRKTVRVFIITRGAIGMIAHKRFCGNIYLKRIHSSMEHIKPSKCKSHFWNHVKHTDTKRKAAKTTRQPVPALKRLSVAPDAPEAYPQGPGAPGAYSQVLGGPGAYPQGLGVHLLLLLSMPGMPGGNSEGPPQQRQQRLDSNMMPIAVQVINDDLTRAGVFPCFHILFCPRSQEIKIDCSEVRPSLKVKYDKLQGYQARNAFHVGSPLPQGKVGHLSTCYTQYKRGDLVDIKSNEAVQKDEPGSLRNQTVIVELPSKIHPPPKNLCGASPGFATTHDFIAAMKP